MAGSHKSDKELLKACFSGDREAWEEFVHGFSKLVYYSVHQTFKVKGLVPDQDEVEDLYGNVFLSLFESDFARLRSFRGKNDCSLASWIRLIASRKTLDHLREKGRRSRLIDTQEDLVTDQPSEQDVERETLHMERAKIAQEAMASLNADDITFLNLYYEQELPPERIADILGVAVSTVYSKKNRVREKLKRIIEEKSS